MEMNALVVEKPLENEPGSIMPFTPLKEENLIDEEEWQPIKEEKKNTNGIARKANEMPIKERLHRVATET